MTGRRTDDIASLVLADRYNPRRRHGWLARIYRQLRRDPKETR
jgi:hypothetical protein